jgi:hypothetical protein
MLKKISRSKSLKEKHGRSGSREAIVKARIVGELLVGGWGSRRD